jgi:hypothetical protein
VILLTIKSEPLIESLNYLLYSSNLGPPWLSIPVLVILVMNSRCKTVSYTDEHDGYPLESAMEDDIISIQRMAQPQKLIHVTQQVSP